MSFYGRTYVHTYIYNIFHAHNMLRDMFFYICTFKLIKHNCALSVLGTQIVHTLHNALTHKFNTHHHHTVSLFRVYAPAELLFMIHLKYNDASQHGIAANEVHVNVVYTVAQSQPQKQNPHQPTNTAHAYIIILHSHMSSPCQV